MITNVNLTKTEENLIGIFKHILLSINPQGYVRQKALPGYMHTHNYLGIAIIIIQIPLSCFHKKTC